MTRKRKISVTHKTIGGGSKRSYLKSSGSQAYSKPDSTVPGQSTEPVGHVDEEASGCQNEETHYTKCNVRRLGVWNSLKPEMLRLSFESLAPASQFCSICKEHAEYRCLQCSTTAVFCETCIRATHRNSLHLPEKWNTSYYETASYGFKLYLSEEHSSHPVHTKDMNVIVDTGKICTFTICFDSCEPETCTLLRYGLWPATPENPQTAFSIALLELFHNLSLECQVSLEGFCNTLRWKNGLSLAEVNMLYRALKGESISQFRHHYYERKTFYDNSTLCPACPKTDGEIIVSLDGNFGLVRKKTSGKSSDEPLHGTRMFAKDKDVEQFLLSYPDSSTPSEDCSNFKAGNRVRSKKQQGKLDVNGVFGACCRHDIPIMFLNMSHGERLAYPMFVINELLNRCQGKNVKLKVLYDVACVLERHLQTKGGEMPDLSLGVPAMHIFGHKLPCQITYSTRRLQGFGLSDGEGMERLWSFLRRFARVTKEMTPSHRLDLLTDGLLHYRMRKAADLDVQLCQRLEKADKVLTVAREQMATILTETSEQDVLRWTEREIQHAKVSLWKRKTKYGSVPKWKKTYITHLLELHQMRVHSEEPSNADEIQVESRLRAIERTRNITKRWEQADPEFQSTLGVLDRELRTELLLRLRTEARDRATLLQLKQKYPDGQAIALRLSKQINGCNIRLKKNIAAYNCLQWPPQVASFPFRLEFQEACDVSFAGYLCLDENTEEVGVPRSTQRCAIDALHLKNRASEEKLLLQREMAAYIQYHEERHASLKAAINDTNHPGVNSFLIQSVIQLQRTLENAKSRFQKTDNFLPIVFPQLSTGPHARELRNTELYLPLEDDYDEEEEGGGEEEVDDDEDEVDDDDEDEEGDDDDDEVDDDDEDEEGDDDDDEVDDDDEDEVDDDDEDEVDDDEEDDEVDDNDG